MDINVKYLAKVEIEIQKIFGIKYHILYLSLKVKNLIFNSKYVIIALAFVAGK